MGVPVLELAVGVMVYAIVAAAFVVLVRIWAIVAPVPSEKPDAVPLVKAAVHMNVAVPMLLDKAILVVAPLQIVWEAGVAITTGLSLTVTTTSRGCPTQPAEFLSTTDKL